ncbi:hypothetical protein [Nocardiopsis quinghaiensis]|uniref:hypothetical protein n=1 Tax=Nocardiopsis quinghaiensis TaxID=464995 RepID=UPI0016805800|nr:hypothetical protein [Nocardiopsis quinghaiensis]
MGTDHGRRVGFGVLASPESGSPRDLWALLPVVEHGGLESVGVQDHPYQRRHPGTPGA